MNQKQVIVLLVAALMLGAAVAVIAYSFFYIEGVKVYDMSIIVGDHIGFDVDNMTLAFGMVMPGSSSSTRFIVLENWEDRPLKVEFRASGDIADWVSLGSQEMILQPSEIKKVPVSATAPPDAEFGEYSGIIKIIFKRL